MVCVVELAAFCGETLLVWVALAGADEVVLLGLQLWFVL